MKLLKNLIKRALPLSRAGKKAVTKMATRKPVGKPVKKAVQHAKPAKAAKKSTKKASSQKKSISRSVKPTQKSVKPVEPKKATQHRKGKLQQIAGSKRPTQRTAQRSRPRKNPAPKVHEFAQTLLQQQQEDKKQVKAYPVLPGAQSARVAMLVPMLKEMVRKGVISDWLINLQHNRNANIYVERNFVTEDELTAIREDVLLTIYERFPDGSIGETQLPIITSDAAVAKQQILDGKTTCQYARKKAFTLPEPSDGIIFPQGHDEQMLRAAFAGEGLVVPRDILQQIRHAMTQVLDVKVNCLEVLTSASTARVLNSNGIDISFHKTSIYLEIVMTCKTRTEEREFVMSRIAVSPDQLDIKSLIAHQTQIVRDATAATQNPGFTGDVLLSGQSVTEVFAPHHDLNPLILHTSAKLDTMGLSSLRLNQPIGHFIGEPITITSNPSLPLGLCTVPVDEEGTPLRPVELVRNGVFANHIATARYAQYLNVQRTGNITNIQLQPGATREQHLRGNDYLEVVSFSWFNPNPFSGDFSAEIRLAYHWKNGRRHPLRGGTLVGNIFKNILNTRFSKETIQSGQYYGPRAILFKGATVTKFE